MDVPNFRELFNPTLKAIRDLGGSGSIQEITEKIVSQLDLPDEVVQRLHKDGPMTELEYRLTWSRSYLKKSGIITNSARGIWTFTQSGRDHGPVDPDQIVRSVLAQNKLEKARRKTETQTTDTTDEADDGLDEVEVGLEDDIWREHLLGVLLKMSPTSFEKLCQRLLRESGFTEVKVTGKSGDGGIDVEGVLRFADLIGFPVKIQCKRYKGSVGPSLVRDFRGGVDGRDARCLLITTGNFTREAKNEAVRPGAIPIDLIDGNQLVEKLKELELGVKSEMVEQVIIDEDWFQSI